MKGGFIFMQEPELKAALIKFEQLLSDYDDNSNATLQYKNFLKNLVRVRCKNVTLPASEIITIIKHDRPNIFSHLKKVYSHDSTIHFLTQININYEVAQTKLSEIKSVIK